MKEKIGIIISLENYQSSGFGLSKIVFQFVPVQDFSKSWTDEELYEKYGLTDEEITFIESMIRPMELGGDDNGN